MDFRELINRFLGFPNRRPPGSGYEYYSHDDSRHPSSGQHNGTVYDYEDGENEDESSFQFFFRSPESNNSLDGIFEHFNSGGIISEIEHFHRQMEEMMRAFGSINFTPTLPHSDISEDEKRSEFPSFSFGNSSPFFHNGNGLDQQPHSPRDFMLKDGSEDSESSHSKPSPKLKDPEIGPIYMPQKPNTVQDTDLDGKLSDHDIMSLVKPPVEPPCQQQPQVVVPRSHPPNFFSSRSSVTTFSSYTGADGKIEKKKTVRDSSGNEETTVTRSVGDKSHSVTTVIKQDGSQEKHETFHNMDENDKGKFEDAWRSKQTPHQAHPADELVQPYAGPQIDMRDRDLFSKLFGFRIPK